MREQRESDASETWCLASSIAAFALPGLKMFRELSIGHPADRTAQEWNDDLNEMIWAFTQIVDDETWSFKDPERVQAALRKFGADFLNLWW